jgi:hypothetical protein
MIAEWLGKSLTVFRQESPGPRREPFQGRLMCTVQPVRRILQHRVEKSALLSPQWHVFAASRTQF